MTRRRCMNAEKRASVFLFGKRLRRDCAVAQPCEPQFEGAVTEYVPGFVIVSRDAHGKGVAAEGEVFDGLRLLVRRGRGACHKEKGRLPAEDRPLLSRQFFPKSNQQTHQE